MRPVNRRITKERLLTGFRHTSPGGRVHKMFTRQEARKLLGKERRTVVSVPAALDSITKQISSSAFMKKRGRKPKVKFCSELSDRNTLILLAKYSLRERVILLNSINPALKMTHTKLHKIYRQAGVKYKAVKKKVCWRRNTSAKLIKSDESTMAHLKQRVESLDRCTEELIFVDECLFNAKHMKDRAWMIAGHNVVPNRSTVLGEPVACLGAISK
jgi:phage antirepressor YoqD-like protein